MNDIFYFDLLGPALLETLIMVLLSTIISIFLGLPLGVLLYLTDRSGLNPLPKLNLFLNGAVNILRSFPFLILMIAIIPFTRLLIGRSTGTIATVVPLSIAAFPFVARLIETALKEVDEGLIEASLSMGSSTFQIVRKVLIPEALPSIIDGVTLTIITLVGYSAMAGAVGGGGLGHLAISYGYNRYQLDVMVLSVLVIIIMVQSIQFIGNKVSYNILKNR